MAESREKKVILLVGGSGYLGLHLLEDLASPTCDCTLAYTYNSHPAPAELVDKLPNVLAFHLDLRSGEGLQEISKSLGTPDVLINCAAISVPRACEQEPEAAKAINVPTVLVQWLNDLGAAQPPFLIHLSTDQVYKGDKSFYEEKDETKPVNTYGETKVMAEKYIQSNYDHYAILRSSIIYGPQPFIPLPKTLPLQWIDGVLSSGSGADFFEDEYRCPVYVKDVVQAIKLLMEKHFCGMRPMYLLLNIGGPDRLSRAAMAETVAQVRGYDTKLVRRVSSQTAVNRGVVSPPDISMDVSKIVAELNMKMTDFATGVAMTLSSK
ncbi:uncharacterized protein [Physcomitrium patens]|nr:methionine adenosyltransferase 2 subunit beta-like [Physcomitrium patens]XP_024377113.1 methionine adenosyltransferase 2 subunit beta-like [Physcomitrium patens]XP_024377114.1 methionine adenosyltransferase 2 subunit beta-like [Physcomitrium patens]PNR52874.1 hypothetical protein PHYPA_009249 [Physcomitrium patens]|eukprot:XP_024377112.1 methionine adenosyltransferase 2 subunit beta-like [Physcomitrella patens]